MDNEFERLSTRLGEHIKRLRTLNQLTQVELAEQAGRPQSSIARVESSASADVGLALLYDICRSLDVSVAEVLAVAEGRQCARSSNKAKLATKWERIRDRVNKLPESKRDWVADLVEVGLRNSANW